MNASVKARSIRLMVLGGAIALSVTAATMGSPASASPAAPTSAQTSVSNIAPASGNQHGCRLGYVCTYDSIQDMWDNRPDNTYYTYGAHRLYNEWGTQWVLNNQTGGAWAAVCEGRTGGWCRYVSPGGCIEILMDPYNLIVLKRPGFA